MADAKSKPPPVQINAPVILLVGKTGAGKSTLGNLLLKTSEDENPTFHVSDSFSSVTKKSSSASYKIGDEIYNIIDTPGILDTDDPTEDILKEIARTIQKCAYGIRAILFVFEAKRFTNEQKNTLDGITMFLGEESLQYMISVFSHCNKRQTKDPEYFKKSCWNEPVKDFVDSMNNRWAISPNAEDFSPDNLVHKQRLKELKKHITSNIKGVYTNDLFEKARKKQEENERMAKEAEEKRKKEYEKILMSKGEALASKYYEEQRKKDEEKFLEEKEKEITSLKNEFQGIIENLKSGKIFLNNCKVA